ncbi:MAG: cyclic nucleotide-binding domain-containing protein [Ilumatobacteraceae bacterium]
MEIASSSVEELTRDAPVLRLAAGDVLVEQGDVADSVYVINIGSLTAYNATPHGPVEVGSVAAGQFVGEITVIAGGRRTATLRAAEATEVSIIGRDEFERWLAETPELADEVSAQARERIDRGQVAAMVTDLVGSAESSVVQDIVDRVLWRRLEAGELLFEQGDESDAAYFIVGGRVVVSIRDGDDMVPVSELGRGEVVGELGLLDDAPRAATVRAVRDTTLAVFPTAVFEELVTRSPGMMLHVARGILTRLHRTPRRRIGLATSVTVMVTAPVDAVPIVSGLAAEVARFGTVEHLSSDGVDSYLNRPGISQAASDTASVPRLAEFMHEADVGNDYVVMEADRDMSPWTRRVLRQADRVVVVCSARPDDAERRLVSDVFDTVADLPHVSRMVALLHAEGERPTGTAEIMRRVRADHVVHLRQGSDVDLGRLGRLASGNGVGLVLSGGGARGLAHLGVHRALLEAGVPIDAVAGCSMGAPLAGGMALGLTGDALEAEAARQFRRLLDYTLPVVSLVRGRRISAAIDDAFASWDIEDLWLPFYCVSTNLTQARLEIHRRGPAARAIRASVAIPGILPPVPCDGDLLVDGGVLNNLPFEAMRADGTIDTVIAIDVAPRSGPRARTDYGSSVSGLKALGAAIRPGRSPFPSVSAVLMRSMLTGSVINQRAAMRDGAVDLLIELELPGIGLLEFERLTPIAANGYRSSIEQVRSWASSQSWMARP